MDIIISKFVADILNDDHDAKWGDNLYQDDPDACEYLAGEIALGLKRELGVVGTKPISRLHLETGAPADDRKCPRSPFHDAVHARVTVSR